MSKSYQKSLIGQQFGRLTVVEFYPCDKRDSYWLCECNCKNKGRKVVHSSALKSGATQSWGCLQYETKTKPKVFIDKNLLKQKYIDEKCPTQELAIFFNCHVDTIRKYLKKYEITDFKSRIIHSTNNSNKKETGYIYLIENKINNKKYVGKTIRTIEGRWKQHLDDVNRRDNHLYLAMRKYGVENFTISEIEHTDNCNEREKYWIQYYNSYKEGYNETLGGDGSSILEFSNQEIVDKYLELKSVKGVAEYFKCNVATISTRLKNSNIKIYSGGDLYSNDRPWKAIKINQFSKDGNYIQSFNCIKDAARWIIENNYTNNTTDLKCVSVTIGAASKKFNRVTYSFKWTREN